ncbi:pectinesterase 3-like [Gastrolobium bilobum]|uniref:pectinesterase 3-like n=1 Tax=Gastrolobium bilobum TaxID=150636 RepID=UPI002AB25D10|nr:pectinesterase 3-like [Gastrolobium bilobum]
MGTLEMFKGYSKVEEDHHHLEDQRQQQRHSKICKPLTATFSIFAMVFLTLTIAFALATLIHHVNTESPEEEPLNSAESIRAVCNVTRFPDSCFSAISSSTQNPTDPEAILRLSLRVTVDELSKVASSLRAMASNSKGSALVDCKDQMDDALSRLNDSLSAMAADGGCCGSLTDAKISDIQTWVSAAVTDQQTCLDGLEEMGLVGAVVEVKSMMKSSTEYTSNSLAIVANIRTLLHQFHMPLH